MVSKFGVGGAWLSIEASGVLIYNFGKPLERNEVNSILLLIYLVQRVSFEGSLFEFVPYCNQ